MPDLAVIAMLVLGIALAHGANARLARLFTEDKITRPLRDRLGKRFGHSSLIYEWANCPWCLGWWTAWPITAAAWFPLAGTHHWGLYFLATWSVAHAAGRLNHDHGGR